MNRRLLLVALATVLAGAFLAAAVPATPTTAYSGGIPGRTTAGCTCHGQQPSPGVTATIDGLPQASNPGAEYALTVTVSGGPHNGGGFDLAVDRGTLRGDDANAQTFNDREVGHDSPDATTWRVLWTAPDSGTATFHLAANSVNLDGDDTGDAWAFATYQVPSAGGGETAAAAPQTAGELLWLPAFAAVGALAFAAAVGYLRPPRVPAPLLRRKVTAGALRSTPHGVLFVVGLLVGATLTVPGVVTPGHDGAGGASPQPAPPEVFQAQDTVTTQQAWTQQFPLDAAPPSHVAATLTWTDEADQARHQNLPDTLQLEVAIGSASASEQGANPQGGEGSVAVELHLEDAGLTAQDNTITVTVTLVSSGPQAAQPRGFGLRDRADGSNAFAVDVNATFDAATPAPSGGGGPGTVETPAPPAEEPQYATHSMVVAAGGALFAAALVAMAMLRGYLPATLLPERMRPTRARHAWLGALAVGLLGTAGAVGVATAVAEGAPFAAHGIFGLIVLVGVGAQGALGYMAYRGRPTKALHGLVAAAVAGALVGTAVGGLAMFLG